MTKSFLLLLALLATSLLAAGQAATPVPTDLAVEAEIVGHKYYPARSEKEKPELRLYAKMTLHNNTNKTREVTIMSCSWNWNWTAEGPYNLCGPPGCDANGPFPLPIPPGQAIVFYDELCHSEREGSQQDSVAHFKLGFVDVTIDNFMSMFFPPRKRKPSKVSVVKTPVVYWSNELTDEVRPTSSQQMTDEFRARSYHLTGAGK